MTNSYHVTKMHGSTLVTGFMQGSANKKIIIFDGENDLNQFNDNVDVEIELKEGRRYTGTIFTFTNIQRFLEKSCEKVGLYRAHFNCPDMLLMKELSIEGIIETILWIEKEGVLIHSFKLINET